MGCPNCSAPPEAEWRVSEIEAWLERYDRAEIPVDKFATTARETYIPRLIYLLRQERKSGLQRAADEAERLVAAKVSPEVAAEVADAIVGLGGKGAAT